MENSGSAHQELGLPGRFRMWNVREGRPGNLRLCSGKTSGAAGVMLKSGVQNGMQYAFMSLKPQELSGQSGAGRRARHLFYRRDSGAGEYTCVPYFYVEARIDFADVRTGHHVTCEFNDLMEIDSLDDEFLWTPDMVHAVDPARLQTSRPEGADLGALPDSVTEDTFDRLETHYIRYLLRHAETRILRNFALNLYSLPGESREEFHKRCMEILNESFRGELDELREVANRRLERIERKYLRYDRPGEFESERRMTQARSRYHATAEAVAELFLTTELSMHDGGNVGLHIPNPHRPDLEEALETLEVDVRRDIQRLLRSYQERVSNTDEYIIHPGLKDLHLVRTGIVWMPPQVQRA
jgi:hypothetical protein